MAAVGGRRPCGCHIEWPVTRTRLYEVHVKPSWHPCEKGPHEIDGPVSDDHPAAWRELIPYRRPSKEI
ncbi:hypothetical protein Barb4_04832 [Bacteroidales bacterium Barb4]|nr:hypothetical protein Barb4_04832 [Bacteroidales bacterium Barb4]